MVAYDKLTPKQKLELVEAFASPGWSWDMRARAAWEKVQKLLKEFSS